MMSRWRTLSAAGILVGLLGCGDETLQRVEPRIVVEPDRIDFGDGCIGEDNPGAIVIRNLGLGRLEIAAIDVVQGAEVYRVVDPPARIEAQKEASLDVFFVPLVPKAEYPGQLVIRSNDPDRPALEVPLFGVGGIREIEVVPLDIDFGVVNEGVAPTRTVEIKNLGGDPLVIGALTWTSTSVDLAPARPPIAPLEIAAKTSTSVTILYDPVDLGADSGVLRIESNDEDEPIVEVQVRGRANLAPRALAWICEKEPGTVGCTAPDRYRSVSATVGRLLGIDGRDSTDPEGSPLEFRWEIVEMPDRRPILLFGNEDIARRYATGEVEVPEVGRYVLRLVARDDRGLDSFDTPESRVAILPKDLEVFLTWDLATDVDLHLVRPSGAIGDYGSGRVGTSTGSDCSTFNRSPDWGMADNSQDNPLLERDVVSGRGPELVSLDQPESGTYRAYAHYCDSRHVNTNVNAFVEVYSRGALVDRVPVMDGQRLLPGQLWEAARITWDAQQGTAIVEAGTDAITMRPDLCVLQ